MSYSVVNNIAQINGEQGIYDGKIADKSSRYGRNAINNFHIYQQRLWNPATAPDMSNLASLSDDVFDKTMDKFDAFLEEGLPPFEYEVQYMPTKKLDKKALFAAACEEMGQVDEIRVDVLSKIMQNRLDAQLGKNSIRMSARAMDLNRDNKISVDEYSASILLKDSLSHGEKYAKKNVQGSFTKNGANALVHYNMAHNFKIANSTYQKIYDSFKLGSN